MQSMHKEAGNVNRDFMHHCQATFLFFPLEEERLYGLVGLISLGDTRSPVLFTAQWRTLR